MKKNKYPDLWFPENNMQMISMTILSFFLIYYNLFLGIIGFLCILYFLYKNFNTYLKRKEVWQNAIEDLSFEMDDVMKKSLIHLPTPMIILEFDGSIFWHNQSFLNLVDQKNLISKKINQIMPNLKLRKVLNDDKELYTNYSVGDKTYNVTYKIVKTREEESKYLTLVYFYDHSDFIRLSHRYYSEKVAIGIIQMDSYDEVLESASSDFRPVIIADIEKILKIWASKYKIALKKIEKDKYMMVCSQQYMQLLEKDKFSILDKIREINHGNKLPITLSCGMGMYADDFYQNLEFAESALDLALGRGGDQAVIKKREKSIFYGGKSKGIEKKTKVKARLIAHALKDLMQDCSNVFIMGHKYPDLDALGAAMGVYGISRYLGKESNIILQETNSSIEVLTSKLGKMKEYQNLFLTHEEAIKHFSKDTLVIVVDTNRPNFTEFQKLLEMQSNVVVIDHHRRGVQFIEDAVLTYHETYASSTCEMVTELIQYISEKPFLRKIEAEALLAGITLDTKNFTFRTGVRTFEAAASLKKLSADSIEVKKLFQGDVETFSAKAEIIRNAKITNDVIAISQCEEGFGKLQLAIAQGADELLNIKGIKASIVLGKGKDETIYLSARSLGEINVHVIMEKLGGGGHIDIAGAQIKNSSVEKVLEKLKNIIQEYLKDNKED